MLSLKEAFFAVNEPSKKVNIAHKPSPTKESSMLFLTIGIRWIQYSYEPVLDYECKIEMDFS